jgi:predicted membrane channel-forming protein YqfA (hemolysin III family)
MMRLVGIAALVLIASYVPLILVGLADPDANPIGLGLLSLAGTLVAAGIVVFAIVARLRRRPR